MSGAFWPSSQSWRQILGIHAEKIVADALSDAASGRHLQCAEATTLEEIPMTLNKTEKETPPKRFCVMCLADGDKQNATHVIDGAGYCKLCCETMVRNGNGPAVTIREHLAQTAVKTKVLSQYTKRVEPAEVERAGVLFAKGESVTAVSIAIGVSWPTAKKLQERWLKSPEQKSEEITPVPPAVATKEPEPDRAVAIEPAALEATDEEADSWDIPITIPVNRVNDIFRAFTIEEKFAAIQHVIQSRMDAALEG
jgi:hypothetical protein